MSVAYNIASRLMHIYPVYVLDSMSQIGMRGGDLYFRVQGHRRRLLIARSPHNSAEGRTENGEMSETLAVQRLYKDFSVINREIAAMPWLLLQLNFAMFFSFSCFSFRRQFRQNQYVLGDLWSMSHLPITLFEGTTNSG